MRSLVTGRVVDSYTNIPTVKLFAHADREDGYAKEGMSWMLDTVNRSMRMSTLMTSTLQILSGVLIFTMSAISIWLWYNNAITTGAIAFAIGLTLRIKAMSQWIIWEVAGLFEDVGVIQDGIETIARDRSIKDAEDASPLVVSRGRNPLRGRDLQLWQARTGARPHRGRSPERSPSRRARRWASSGVPARASRRWPICCCASTTSSRAAS